MAEAKQRADWAHASLILFTLRRGLTPKKHGDWTLEECTPYAEPVQAKPEVIEDTKAGLDMFFGLLEKRG